MNHLEQKFIQHEVKKEKENLEKMSYLQLEDLVFEILESGKLHPEIAKKTEKELLENEDLEREDLIAMVLKLKNLLKKEKSKNQTKEVFGDSARERLKQEEVKENLIKMRELMDQIRNNPENLLGRGSVAEVYSSSPEAKTCFKLILNFVEYQKGNNLEEEMNFLDEAVQLGEIAGVKAPMPFYLRKERGLYFLAMEKLKAVSLEDVLEKRAPLPANFNEEDFFKSLEEFVKALHEKKKIHHRDLHEGNVMIDLATGKPRVIDFGLARFIYFNEKEERAGKGKNPGVDDFEMIEKLKEKIKKFKKSRRD